MMGKNAANDPINYEFLLYIETIQAQIQWKNMDFCFETHSYIQIIKVHIGPLKRVSRTYWREKYRENLRFKQ